jgi:hypothetical protein
LGTSHVRVHLAKVFALGRRTPRLGRNTSGYDKLDEYAALGVLYYVIYSSRRRRKPRLEVHKLVNGEYELQPGNPVWMPEIGLGIGCQRGNYSGVTREWMYWYSNRQGG